MPPPSIIDPTTTNSPASNPPIKWAVLTSCLQNYQFSLFENPSRISFHDGLITLQNPGQCEIIKGEDFTYYIKNHDIPIIVKGKLLNHQELVKLESGDKIGFSVENDPVYGAIHNFVFSSVYTGVSENFTNKEFIYERLKCSVCLQIIYDCVTLDCMHNLCSSCLMTSLQTSQKCPVCRQIFKEFKRNPLMNEICQYYHNQYPGEEISQAVKKEKDEVLTRSKFEDRDGNIYNGQWKSIKKHGEGELEFSTKDSFKGLFNEDFMQEGEMKYSDGSIYQGSWKDNKKHGYGTFEFYINQTPFEYKGGFDRDLRHGEGILIFKADHIEYSFFKGLFFEGNPDTRGEILYKNGDHYNGEINLDFKRNGPGIMLFADSSIYQGDWCHDKRHGKGKYLYQTKIFSLEKEYEGDWKDDKMEGDGVMLYTNGDVYTGEWLQGVKEGKGEMRYVNGSKYYGDWLEGEKSGIGEMTESDGVVYKGEFSQDNRAGFGEVNDPIEGCFQMVSE